MNQNYHLPETIHIKGGRPLYGTVDIQGAKNAALPVMAAALLLKDGRLTLSNVPDLYDIRTMADLMRSLGASVKFENHTMTIDVPAEIRSDTPVELVRKMRASSIVLGPLAARCGHALLPLPGGCDLGSRPLDFHLKGLSKMGASIELKNGAVTASAPRLKGVNITLDFPSVGATENLMMAAALADGVTLIDNAAREPEIVNLAETLRLMGAEIKGDGTSTIRIAGTDALHSATSEIIPDRIEAATYLIAGAITHGAVTVRGIKRELLDSILVKLEECGVDIDAFNDEITAKWKAPLSGVNIKTLPFPGFPTDAQPQMMALLVTACGTSNIQESIFDSRLNHINEFKKTGAKINITENIAIITGVEKLYGADLLSSNLRAGAACILIALGAEGESTVTGLKHVWRGYEALGEKLRAIGAEIDFSD